MRHGVKTVRRGWIIGLLGLLVAVAVVAVVLMAPANDFASHLRSAESLRKDGQLRASVIHLKNAIELDPAHGGVRRLLGEVYTELGDWAGAEKELRAARRLGIDAHTLALPLGKTLLAQGKHAELLQQLTAVSATDARQEAEIRVLRGQAWLAQGENDKARVEFDEAVRLGPKLTSARLGLAQLTLAQGKIDAARVEVERALAADRNAAEGWSLMGDVEQAQGDGRAAEAAYSKALALDPKASVARAKRALARIELGNYAAAEQDLAELRPVAGHPLVKFAEGMLAFRRGEFDAARTAFSDVLNHEKNNLRAFFYAGMAHYSLGELEQAEHYLRRVVAALPGASAAAYYLAQARLRLQDYDGAATALKPLLLRSPKNPALLALQSRIARRNAAAGGESPDHLAELRPDSTQAMTQQGFSHLVQGEAQRGVAALQRVAQKDAKAVGAEVMLILGQLQARQPDKALAAAQALQKKRPYLAAAHTLEGLARIVRGEYMQARKAFEAALRLAPGEPDAAANLAALEIKAGRPEQAQALYRQVLQYHPEHEGTHIQLARLEAQRGDGRAFVQALAAVDERFPGSVKARVEIARLYLDNGRPLEALGVAREAHKRQPGSPLVLEVLGQAELATNDTAGAIRDFTRLSEIQPGSPQAHYLLAKAYAMARGVSQVQQSLNRSVAKGALQHALTLNPQHREANLGLLYLEALDGDYPAAQRWLKTLKTHHDRHPEVAEAEAWLALKQGQTDRAMQIYSAARTRFPDANVWVIKQAALAMGKGDREAGIARLKGWLDKHPDDAQVRFWLANSYLLAGQEAPARAAFELLLKRMPGNTIVLNNLAWLLREKDPVRALDYAQQAYKLRPKDPEVLDTLGYLLAQQGQAQRGLKLLDQALQARPQNPSVRYHRALALYHSGDKSRARVELSALLAAKTAFPERQAARSLLDALQGDNKQAAQLNS